MKQNRLGFSVTFSNNEEVRFVVDGFLSRSEAAFVRSMVDVWRNELIRRIDDATVVALRAGESPTTTVAQ